jgi:replicative DNA helicase
MLDNPFTNKEEPKALIENSARLVNKAVKQIAKFQTGEEKPIITRFNHLNTCSLGGIFGQTITTIAGSSGHGKSLIAQLIEEDFLNPELNPDCESYILLRCSFEMTVVRLLLRRLMRETGESPEKLLFEVPDEELTEKFKDVANSERDARIFYMEQAPTPEAWLSSVEEFLEQHKEANKVLVSIDHLALIKNSGFNKKGAMDILTEGINNLKKTYPNTAFLILSQLNREIDTRTALPELAPRKSDLYNTDTLFQISDIVVAINNPAKRGFGKYMLVPVANYEHLREHFNNPEVKNSNFLTEGRVFWHYMKIRESDINNPPPDLYVEYYGV